MAILDLFSKRQRRGRGEVSDVYSYSEVPPPLRVQIVHVVRDALGQDSYGQPLATNAYRFLHDTLAREYGLFTLTNERDEPEESLFNFFLKTSDYERALDVIELTFRYIERVASENDYRYFAKPRVTSTAAIEELNDRFREHAVGYQYEGGELIRVDSQFLHAEAVKPALALLADARYQAADEEFRRAHEHYRHDRFEEAMTDCLKAIESALKTICLHQKWPCQPTDTAKRLFDIVFERGLIPLYLQSEFSALRATLEGGVPTVRNKQAAHGQGPQGRVIPRHLAAYVLQLTGASILLLVEAENAL
jgi:tetratricopeptide (TPR) repeat protein